MPLLQESLIKIYRGTRRMGMGRPVLVLTGDAMNLNAPLGEFYIFHEFPDMPFIYSRTSCAHPDALYIYDFGQYPEIFSAGAMMEAQFRAAKDHLENEVAMRDRQIASDLFYTASPLVFEEVGPLPLVEFAFFQRFIKEREQMFRFSKSQAIAQLKEKLIEYPEAVLTREPKG
jgi:hypothetical protein